MFNLGKGNNKAGSNASNDPKKEDAKKTSSSSEQATDKQEATATPPPASSTDTVVLTEDQKKAHLAAGLNEDGSAKEVSSPVVNTFTDDGKTIQTAGEYVPSEFVIKEIMHQKGIDRNAAIKHLKSVQ